ncbi:MAG: PQQ-binding-like beta-propeller repeat protein [Verrucomicrobiales bacterium]|nr:PQQ-binding-like beta-propeller repeat protein [Verrucomicrobiales bacterium]
MERQERWKRILSLVALLALSGGPTPAADWPQWRGPNQDGISQETGWLDRWPDQGPPVAWKANVGLGFSSIVVAQGRAFTLGHADGQDSVVCLNADTGQEVWRHQYPADLGDKFYEGGTTGTPTVEGDRVFTLSRWGDAFCFESATGKIVWSKNVQKETGIRIPGWGFSGSPVVFKDLLLLNVGDAGLALEKATGKVVWKSEDKDAGYSTPLLFERGGEWYALLGSAQSYVAVKPQTGQEAWRLKWLTQYGVNAADPILHGDRILLATGYGKGAGLFKMGSGEPESVWKSKVLRTQLNAAVRVGDYVYGVDGDTTARGALKCVEFATGTEKWTEPNVGSGGVIVAEGRLIVLSDRGELMVAPAVPDAFAPTARAQILGGKFWTVPTLAHGRIYCRSSKGEIAAVDVRKK